MVTDQVSNSSAQGLLALPTPTGAALGLRCVWFILRHKHLQIKKKASTIDKAKASSIYICSKAAIMKRLFNVSQGLDETLKMLLFRKKMIIIFP